MTDKHAFDCGYDHYKTAPDVLLIEIWWFANKFVPDNAPAFVDGYQAARKQRDEAQNDH